MIVACELCGAIRLEDGQWIESDLQAPALATCPRCLLERKASMERHRLDGERRVRENAARGYGPAKSDEDVFKGFREPKPKGE